MKRLYTCKDKRGEEVRLYHNTINNTFELCSGRPGGMFRTEMIFDNIGDAYRAYNDRLA